MVAMVYLWRTHTVFNLAFLLFNGLLWLAGGWLIVRRGFAFLAPRARLWVGLAMALLLEMFFVNLWGQWLAVPPAFWAALLSLLALSLWSALTMPAWDGWKDEWLAAWPPGLALAGLTLLFWAMLRGMTVFDDYFHLPLLSTIAAGNFPPQFHLNADVRLDYHYALHLLAAPWVRFGGMTVWAAWDLIRAFVAALTFVVAWHWGRQASGRDIGGWVLLGVLAFGGGARWLMLFLPGTLVRQMGADLTLLGSTAASGPDLFTLLTSPWQVGGLTPFQVPWVFLNGFRYPITLSWGGSSSLPLLTLLLLLLLYPQRPLRGLQWGVWVVLLATYGLIQEYGLLFWLAGMGGVWLRWAWLRWRHGRRDLDIWLRQWAALALLSLALAVVQGGVLQGMVRALLPGVKGPSGFGYSGFTLRWPPALVSGHLGALSLFSPGELLLALFELGVLLMLFPLALRLGWRWVRRAGNRHWEAGLIVGAALGFFLPLFLRYGAERDQARLHAFLLSVSAVVVIPRLLRLGAWFSAAQRKFWWALYGMAIFPGVVLFALQLGALQTPQLSDFLQGSDAKMARSYWDVLPADALVLDRKPPRAVTVLGRLTRSNSTTYQTLPEWEALIADLDPYRVAAAGFDFIYMDGRWWNDLNETRTRFDADCVAWLDMPDEPFVPGARWLISVEACR